MSDHGCVEPPYKRLKDVGGEVLLPLIDDNSHHTVVQGVPIAWEPFFGAYFVFVLHLADDGTFKDSHTEKFLIDPALLEGLGDGDNLNVFQLQIDVWDAAVEVFCNMLK